MSVGPYLVTFDEAGADIEHGSTRARYRVQAVTANNAVGFLKYHKRLIFAMMSNTPGLWKPSASSRTPKEGRQEQTAAADHDGGSI